MNPGNALAALVEPRDYPCTERPAVLIMTDIGSTPPTAACVGPTVGCGCVVVEAERQRMRIL
jgi:hypothetical protein